MAASYSSSMRYIEPWSESRGNPFIRTAPDEGFEYMNFKWMDYRVSIQDARPEKGDFKLDAHGFAFRDDPQGGSPETLDILRSGDQTRIQELYYPHIESLVKRELGASRVVIFDNTIRRRDPGLEATENKSGQEQPATMVHCDQSTDGALARIEKHIGVDVSSLLRGRVQMINVWRPLNGPVEDWPLAMMDYRSTKPENLHPTDLWKKQFERRGQTVCFSHDELQKWYYLDGHRPDELTLIKIWDSKEDVEGKLCPHAAFNHPLTKPDANPRESIEVRCIAIHDPVD